MGPLANKEFPSKLVTLQLRSSGRRFLVLPYIENRNGQTFGMTSQNYYSTAKPHCLQVLLIASALLEGQAAETTRLTPRNLVADWLLQVARGSGISLRNNIHGRMERRSYLEDLLSLSLESLSSVHKVRIQLIPE